MPRVKHRYPRNVARRKVASPGTSNRLTRRQELVPSTDVALTGNIAVFSFARPVIVPRNAVDLTGILGESGGRAPISITRTAPAEVTIEFAAGPALIAVSVPFQDPAIRDALTGAYLRAGDYEEPAP